MRSMILLSFGIAILAVQPLRAQGVKDSTGPVPRYQTEQPLPANTTPPTVNRRSNVFSPRARMPLVRRLHGTGRRY